MRKPNHAIILVIATMFLRLAYPDTARANTISTLNGISGTFQIDLPQIGATAAGPVHFIAGSQTPDAIIPNFGNIDWAVSASGLQLTFEFNDQGCCTSSLPFAGPVVELDGITFLSALLGNTNISGFDANRISLSPDGQSLFVNVANGLDLRNNRNVVVNVTASVVPLPAAFPLFAAGLGILGLLGWRRRRMADA